MMPSEGQQWPIEAIGGPRRPLGLTSSAKTSNKEKEGGGRKPEGGKGGGKAIEFPPNGKKGSYGATTVKQG